MYSDKTINKLKRLNFEDYVWILYASISLANVYGNYYNKQYLKGQNKAGLNTANKIFEITIIITFLIYIYFFLRNYKNYKEAPQEEKEVYFVRVIGSIFLIVGAVCLIYYQKEKTISDEKKQT